MLSPGLSPGISLACIIAGCLILIFHKSIYLWAKKRNEEIGSSFGGPGKSGMIWGKILIIYMGLVLIIIGVLSIYHEMKLYNGW